MSKYTIREGKGGKKMKVYSFFSGDTTYISKSRDIRKLQAIGRENHKGYIESCKYLEEDPEVGKDYFVPEKEDIETIDLDTEFDWLREQVKFDNDIVFLDEEIEKMF